MTYHGYEIITCEEYNVRQKAKYDKNIEEWKDLPMGSPMPQIGFYFFYDKGERRTDGYVAVSIDGDTHQWGRTILGLKRKINKLNRGY